MFAALFNIFMNLIMRRKAVPRFFADLLLAFAVISTSFGLCSLVFANTFLDFIFAGFATISGLIDSELIAKATGRRWFV